MMSLLVTVKSRPMRLMLLSFALNASLEADLPPFSQREALIALIFKKGDRLDHTNWRPIN